MVEYRELKPEEIERALFAEFHRRQVVGKCRRKIGGRWLICDDPFVDDWSEAEYAELVECLRRTSLTGGLVAGAFFDGCLKGFVSVEPTPLGRDGQYLDLSSIHVSEELRGQGIGRTLFQMAKGYGRAMGARKLYISAHSAIESQAFYRAMGCTEAEEYNCEHVEKEPCDCQLECLL